jgi:hypothetical protein
MKQLIKKILKEESLKHNLRQQVKDYGWKATAEMVNGPEELAKLAFNNDPMEFLHMFDDMDVVQHEINPNRTLFRYEKGSNLMVYDIKNGHVVISYSDIWSFLGDGFGLKSSEKPVLTTRWLEEVYKLRGVTTERSSIYAEFGLDESY